jgi:hypothetical protein
MAGPFEARTATNNCFQIELLLHRKGSASPCIDMCVNYTVIYKEIKVAILKIILNE